MMVKSRIIERLPERFSDAPVLGAVVEAIAGEIDSFNDQVQFIDDLKSIQTTSGDELDSKWGAMTGLKREIDESDFDYRTRMETYLNNYAGGTIEAIRFAASTALGIVPTEQFAVDHVIPMDSWDYVGVLPEVGPAIGVCVVDWDSSVLGEFGGEPTRLKLEQSLQSAKAAGVKIYAMINFNIVSYADLSTMTYDDLSSMRYTELGRVI